MAYTTERTPNHTTNNYTTNTTVPPQRSGSGVALAVGVVVALVAVIAYFVIASPTTPADDNVNISVDAPAAVENSAERVGDAAAGAAESVGDAAAGAASAVEGAAQEAARDAN
ncbi:hypothetical protein JI664_02720 [Rhodobacter sp. NTK016B]|uniref:hypothetical protein n=1 Tax=Rhodobacter sp. NTK016B TaxID=2759676 RepID=UPI001A8C1EDC|nr:hypothetical protein [Rhodobacter sp. NTK016B]MBN8290868.1 hypothetical protein [Rhodobacter sp. NTK016B]